MNCSVLKKKLSVQK